MSAAEAQARTEAFLTRTMRDALRTVDFAAPAFADEAEAVELQAAARARVTLRHLKGSAECAYRVAAFQDELTMLLQLNVARLVIVYRVPARRGPDALALQQQLERWQRGAEHAGWLVGWREAADPDDGDARYVETYCYATTARDFLHDEIERLYWRTDIVQMTRYFMLEARRCGLRLSADENRA